MQTGRREQLNALEIRSKLGKEDYWAPIPYGDDSWIFKNKNRGSVIVSIWIEDDGIEWIHASIAFPDRTPTYEELKHLHSAVFNNGYAYQVFSPSESHISLHDYALHLWGRVDGKPGLPDFGRFGEI